MNREQHTMRTIAFYSYKGGVGRSLTVANVATYLARLGKNIFVVDMDLEAPGLHYKFLTKQREPLDVRQGMLDVLHDFAASGQPPKSLEPYVFDVGPQAESAGKVHLLPAGAAPSPAYWKNLAKLDWHQLFYADEPRGVPMFLELRALIEETYEPDFLLLDARTGITEMGGIATTVMADQVVFLMLGTREHLEGSRAVMRSIQKQSRSGMEHAPVDIVAVISRVPQRKEDEEAKELERVRTFLNEPAEDLAATLEIDEVFPLHRESALEEREFVLVGSARGIDDSLLLADYIRLFTRFVSPTELETSVGKMIKDIFAKAPDDPDDAEKAMEALSRHCVHPDVSRELLRMYRMRRSHPTKLLSEARTLWQMTRNAADPLIWDIVKKYNHEEAFLSFFESLEAAPYVDFMDAAWSAHGSNDSPVAEKLVDLCQRINDSARAERTLERLLASTSTPSQIAVVKLIDLLCERRGFARALEVVERFKPTLLTAESFVEAWANVLLAEANHTHLSAVVHNPLFPWAVLVKKNIALAARLSVFQGDRDAAQSWFEQLMAASNWRNLGPRVLIPGGALARDLGRKNEFDTRLKKTFDPSSANTMLEAIAKVPALPTAPNDDFGYDGGDDIPF